MWLISSLLCPMWYGFDNSFTNLTQFKPEHKIKIKIWLATYRQCHLVCMLSLHSKCKASVANQTKKVDRAYSEIGRKWLTANCALV